MMELKLRPYPDYQDSGHQWLDRVPSHWRVLPNRALFQEIKDVNHPNERLLSVSIAHGVIPHEKLLAESSKKDSSNLDKSKYKLVQPGDLAYNKMRAWQGAIGVSKHRGIVSPAYVVARTRQKVEPRYYHYLFRTPAFAREAERWSYGITSDMWSLRFEDFKQIYCVLPPLDEQCQIVRFLDQQDRRINRLIRSKQRLIALLNEQKQAVIQWAVTRGLDPDVSFKPSGVEWLGEVPQHWEEVPLKAVADIRISGVDKHSVPGEIEIQLCNYTDVYHQDFINSSHVFTQATATPKEIEAFELRRGDVIITKDSETWNDIAVPAVVTEDLQGVVCGYHLALIRPSEKVTGEYLLRALQAPIIASQLHIAATGVTRYGLSKRSIKSALIPLPPLSEQQAIIESVRQQIFALDETADRARREIGLLREYRTRLIADVVTGKLDVREVKLPDLEDTEGAEDVEDVGIAEEELAYAGK